MQPQKISCKRNLPCPICGGPDWCYMYKGGYYNKTDEDSWDSDMIILYCARYTQGGRISSAGTSVAGEYAYTPNGVFVAKKISTQSTGEYGMFQDQISYDKAEAYWEEKKSRKKLKGTGAVAKKVVKRTSMEHSTYADFLNTVQKEGHYSETVINNIASPDRLDEVYRKFLSLLAVEPWTREELSSHDKWSDKLFDIVFGEYAIRTLPPSDYDRFVKTSPNYNFERNCDLLNTSRKNIMQQLLDAVGEPVGVPGFHLTEKDGERKWSFFGLEGYIIPVIDYAGRVVRLRVRVRSTAIYDMAKKEVAMLEDTNPDKYEDEVSLYGSRDKLIARYAKKTGKYKWFSSADCRTGTVCGVYGLQFMEDYKHGYQKRVIVTEGEKKGIVASIFLCCIVITLPGVAQYSLLDRKMEGSDKTVYEWIREIGADRIAIANDADMLTNENVLNATQGIVNEVIDHGFKVEICTWSEVSGKGIDDCCIAGGTPKFVRLKK